MPYENVRLRVEPPVAHLTLARESHLNAYNLPMLLEIEAALAAAEAEPAVAVLVLRGFPKAFSTGGDLGAVLTMLETGDPETFRDEWLDPVHGLAERMENSRLVIVGVIEGLALAGGLELALACDLLLADEAAKIGDQHINFNLIPGGGNSQRLPRLIGVQQAKELLYTGRWLTGKEAAAIGLVLRAVPHDQLEAAVDELVQVIAKKGPRALQNVKRLVNRGLATDRAAGLELEKNVAAFHMYSGEARAGLERFQARKK